jgi:triosephosphate isomerase (TIM)
LAFGSLQKRWIMKKHIVGNWKMNTTCESAKLLITSIAQGLSADTSAVVGVAPPAVYLSTVLASAGASPIQVGAQNCHEAESGAFTGENSVAMLKDVGAHFTIIGHSERRHVFGETTERLSAKVKSALEKSLPVIFCVGEQLAERDAGDHESVVKEQCKSALQGVSADQMALVRIAYEPVWAIGTGRTASPEQAGAMHQIIRGLLAELYGSDIANNTAILYGGSVKPANAHALLNTVGIDGALVGGASLKSDSFLAIVNAASAATGE